MSDAGSRRSPSLSLVAIALAGRHRSRWSPSLSLSSLCWAVSLSLISSRQGLLRCPSDSNAAEETKPAEVKKAATPPQQQTNSNVQQTSTGAGSPNVQGVQGDVTITVDQSTGKSTTAQKPAAQKPKSENQ